MGNCISKTKSENNNIENNQDRQSGSSLGRSDISLNGYPPINFRKVKKRGFRIGAHVDIGFKDFEAGANFGSNSVEEVNFSENNSHLKLLKSLENENKNDTEKDKIIASLINLKNDNVNKPKPKNEDE